MQSAEGQHSRLEHIATCSASTSTFRSAPHLQLLQLQPRSVRRRAEAQYVDALEAEIRRAATGRRRHHLLRRRHAVAARARGGRATDCRLPRRVRRRRRRRGHARDESRDRHRRTDARASAPPASTASAWACSRCIDEELRRLGRQHSGARARQALGDVRAAGIDNVSLDLMLWLPQQGTRSGRRRSMD